MTKSKKLATSCGSKTVRRRNLTIDILRLVMAALVVYLHINNLLYLRNDLSPVATAIDSYIIVAARLAVPTFFAISGYYFYKKNQADEYHSAIKNIKHLLLILMTGLTFYFVFNHIAQLLLICSFK